MVYDDEWEDLLAELGAIKRKLSRGMWWRDIRNGMDIHGWRDSGGN